MKIVVLGLGYIGLPTASLLATKGLNVLGVDVKGKVVDKIKLGKIHINEPDLDILVKSGINSGKLKASTEIEPGDVFIIAVPTPLKKDKKPELDCLDSAIDGICKVIQENNLIILESTVPVGTTEAIASTISGRRPDLLDENNQLRIHIAHCPERVLPGKILKELIENDRVVGGVNRESTDKAAEFYEIFVNGKIIKTDSRSAELSKLAENSYRDLNIAFANELSMICDRLEISPWDLIKLANHHPRVNILNPGPGVGGHCLAVDPYFIIGSAPDTAHLIKAARETNEKKTGFVVDKTEFEARRLESPTILALGLTYKENIDDLRESPAVKIVSELQKRAFNVVACEPNISESEIHGIKLLELEYGISISDVILILVRHKEFDMLKQIQLDDKIVIDTVVLLK